MVLFFFVFTSCSKDEPVGKELGDNMAVIELGPLLNDFLSRQAEGEIPACSDEAPAYARVMLTHEMGSVDVVVPILNDESGLFTDYDEELAIPIPDGETTTEISLTDFMVYAEEPGAEVMPIWVAPKEGSDFANFVNDPLPIVFDLRAGSKKYVPVEVLCFDDRDVNQYGYQFFDLVPIALYEFCVFANYCTDDGRHYTANYDLDIDYIMGEEVINLYNGESPMTGNTEDDNSGDWFADPLCLAIPAPMYNEGAEDIYLRITVTLIAWDDNYGNPVGDYSEVIELSWNDVQSYFGDNNSIDYEHIFFNCGDDPGQDCPVNEGDTDGDCVPNEEDVCPGYDDSEDMDEDGIPDGCDECPNDFGESENGCPTDDCLLDDDGDGVGNCVDICPGYDDTIDYDGDGIPDGCDQCPEEAADTENGCPVDDCSLSDTDEDGVNDCDDKCIDIPGSSENDGCPLPNGKECETAFMYGDKKINSLPGGSNRWGWVEEFDEGPVSNPYPIYAGAGQNDITKGYLVGSANITRVNGDDVRVQITMEPGYSLQELHVNLTKNVPAGNIAKSPGRYNRNDDVNPAVLDFTLPYSHNDFWIIIHTVSCKN